LTTEGVILSKRILGVSSLAFVALLAACGGGGGGSTGGSLPPTTPTSTPTGMPTSTPSGSNSSTTTATGTVVNDANGAPLAGQRVVLMPFGPCGATPTPLSITPESDGCPTPLPSPQVTTAPNGTFSLGGVPNGHYLLVIGTDSTSTTGTITATVHDNVTLTGGAQALKAPTLPAIPMVTVPAWETNGDYRIATLNATTEVPCFQAWQTERAANNLAGSSVDEWLTENVRSEQMATLANEESSAQYEFFGQDTITSANTQAQGGAGCSELVQGVFPGGVAPSVEASDPRALWFAGQYVTSTATTTAFGVGQFPIDPRSFTDPNHPTWP
jgi:hypothetical protein